MRFIKNEEVALRNKLYNFNEHGNNLYYTTDNIHKSAEGWHKRKYRISSGEIFGMGLHINNNYCRSGERSGAQVRKDVRSTPQLEWVARASCWLGL